MLPFVHINFNSVIFFSSLSDAASKKLLGREDGPTSEETPG